MLWYLKYNNNININKFEVNMFYKISNNSLHGTI